MKYFFLKKIVFLLYYCNQTAAGAGINNAFKRKNIANFRSQSADHET